MPSYFILFYFYVSVFLILIQNIFVLFPAEDSFFKQKHAVMLSK